MSFSISYEGVDLQLHFDSTAYCWGNFAGPLVVKESEAPEYPTATIGLLVGYAIKLVCHLILLGKFCICIRNLLNEFNFFSLFVFCE